MSLIQKGAIGKVFEFQVFESEGVPLNISAASVLEVMFKDPNELVVTYTAELSGDGTDGKFRYTTDTSGILNVVGEWSVQGYYEIDDSPRDYTAISTFSVGGNLND